MKREKIKEKFVRWAEKFFRDPNGYYTWSEEEFERAGSILGKDWFLDFGTTEEAWSEAWKEIADRLMFPK